MELTYTKHGDYYLLNQDIPTKEDGLVRQSFVKYILFILNQSSHPSVPKAYLNF